MRQVSIICWKVRGVGGGGGQDHLAAQRLRGRRDALRGVSARF
jgi:hypothetical protein